MTRFTGTQYEGKAKRLLHELFEKNDIKLKIAGLEPDENPDLIIPLFKIGLEVKSTRKSKFYPSTNSTQYEYLKEKFTEDWPEHTPYYMIYFLKEHCWRMFSITSKSPFKVSEGISVYDFISEVILTSNIVYKNIKYKSEVIKR